MTNEEIQGFTDEAKESAQQTVIVLKELMRQVVQDEEVVKLQAQSARKLYEGFIKEGFDEASALTLVAASFSKK